MAKTMWELSFLADDILRFALANGLIGGNTCPYDLYNLWADHTIRHHMAVAVNDRFFCLKICDLLCSANPEHLEICRRISDEIQLLSAK